jgi:exodeoxyribonuclease VII small subunit
MPELENVDTLSFEEAFAALEGVIQALEKEQQPLEEILALYGRGQVLARKCAHMLDQAELRVRQLQSNGNVGDTNLIQPDVSNPNPL